MLRVVALLSVLLVVIACGNSPGPSASPGVSPSAAPSAVEPSVEPSVSPGPSDEVPPSDAPPASAAPASSAALLPDSLVVVSTRGGECPAGACESVTVIDRSGRVHTMAPEVAELGTVRPDIMAGLELGLDQADFEAIRSVPFTGECPVNFDGQELIFEVSTMTGTQRLASCEVEIDWASPLFIAVANALGEWIPIPLM
jgi:hypothetical protein